MLFRDFSFESLLDRDHWRNQLAKAHIWETYDSYLRDPRIDLYRILD